MNWGSVISRLRVPGLTLLVLGGAGCVQATRLCRLVLGQRGERFILPLRLVSLLAALLGALILLDFIPGL